MLREFECVVKVKEYIDGKHFDKGYVNLKDYVIT